MHYQAHNEETIKEGVEKYGVAAGARKMMSNEYLHADEAVKSGIYITYYCHPKKSECFRVGSNSKCFCGHFMKEHNRNIGTKKINTSCLNCPCKAFAFIPTRPEECGMWWLPRRKEFDVRTWRPKCKCKHTHEEHAPTRPLRCKICPGNCSDFKSDFACISCDCCWEDHEVLYETEQERRMEKKPVGQDYYPLADKKEIQEMVFDPTQMKKATPFMRPRPDLKKPGATTTPALKTGVAMGKIEYGGKVKDEEEYKADYMDYGTSFPSSNSNKFGQDQPVMMKSSNQGGYNAGRYGYDQPTMSKPSASRGVSGGRMTGGVGSKIGGNSGTGLGGRPVAKTTTTSKTGGTSKTSDMGPPVTKSGFKPVWD